MEPTDTDEVGDFAILTEEEINAILDDEEEYEIVTEEREHEKGFISQKIGHH